MLWYNFLNQTFIFYKYEVFLSNQKKAIKVPTGQFAQTMLPIPRKPKVFGGKGKIRSGHNREKEYVSNYIIA